MIKNERGDTLIEVVFSLAILAATLITAFNIANMSYRMGLQARERTQAISINQAQAEMLQLHRNQTIEQKVSGGADQPGDDLLSAIGTACAAACYFMPAQNPVLIQSTALTTANMFNTRIQRSGGCGLNSTRCSFNIRTEWESAIGDDPNVSEFNYVLVDKRGGKPIDCDVAGSALCSVGPVSAP